MSNEINLQEFKMHEKDSGSSSYQIARLTQRIAHLTEHLSTNKHDVSSRRGLLKMVALRRKLLDYVKREDMAQSPLKGGAYSRLIRPLRFSAAAVVFMGGAGMVALSWKGGMAGDCGFVFWSGEFERPVFL